MHLETYETSKAANIMQSSAESKISSSGTEQNRVNGGIGRTSLYQLAREKTAVLFNRLPFIPTYKQPGKLSMLEGHFYNSSQELDPGLQPKSASSTFSPDARDTK